MIQKILFILSGFLYLSVFSGAGQDWIGLSEDSVKKIVEKEFPDLNLNTNTINHVYHYLKYEKSDGMQTMLIFLDDSSKCRYIKSMYDYAVLDKVIQDLNRKYARWNDSLWVYKKSEGKEIIKELKKEDWYFTVITKLKEIEK
jgi:hypothetical protein